jgi:hypothetical protein
MERAAARGIAKRLRSFSIVKRSHDRIPLDCGALLMACRVVTTRVFARSYHKAGEDSGENARLWC